MSLFDLLHFQDALEKMTPSQRAEIFQASIVNDLDEVPAEFLDSTRKRLAAHIEGSSTSR